MAIALNSIQLDGELYYHVVALLDTGWVEEIIGRYPHPIIVFDGLNAKLERAARATKGLSSAT